MQSVSVEKTHGSIPALRVVVIDDDEQHLKFVATLLSQDNVLVFTSPDSRAGLELVRTQHPQLVVVDLIMPGIGGMEILEKIIDSDPSTEVILLTGHYSSESAVEAIQKGACDYLTKPDHANPIAIVENQTDQSAFASYKKHPRYPWKLFRPKTDNFETNIAKTASG